MPNEPTPDSSRQEPTLLNPRLNLEIPKRFQENPQLQAFPKDRITALPIENDDARKLAAGEIERCIREGIPWGVAIYDADQLKTANKFGKKFGDTVIHHSTAASTRTVDETITSPEARIFAFRQEHAADETVFVITGATPEEYRALQENANNLPVVQNITPRFEFSVSGAVITNQEAGIQDDIEAIRTSPTPSSEDEQLDFYQKVKDLVDEKVQFLKWDKDLNRIDGRELLRKGNILKINEAIEDTLGGTRVSPRLIRYVLEFGEIAMTLARAFQQRDGTDWRELESWGVTPDALADTKTPEDTRALLLKTMELAS